MLCNTKYSLKQCLDFILNNMEFIIHDGIIVNQLIILESNVIKKIVRQFLRDFIMIIQL
jgi:hypothetical protein